MRISFLKLTNFKNISGEFSLSPSINLVIGKNGTGKTNFLESIYYLSRTQSFRNNNDRTLIQRDTKINYCKVEAKVEKTDSSMLTEEKKLTYIIADDIGILKKKFLISGVKKTTSEFINYIPCILFLPQNIDLISGSPDGRRREIDDFLSIIYPDFSDIELEYRKILKNRNKLLKQIRKGSAKKNELEYWNEGLIQKGSKIISLRLKTLQAFLPNVKTFAEKLFRTDLQDLKFRYKSKLASNEKTTLEDISNTFEYKINNGQIKEINAGMTLYGPQRDDIDFLNKHGSLSEFASRGEQRLVSFIFKLVMFEFYKNKHETNPILLLDDIMSELDQNHRKKVEETLKNLDTQVIATSTTKEDFTQKFLGTANTLIF
ncbi:DNA replication and repair protein RecF [Candidatus Dojkabacteria bacterium]|nr:DNA replication and repair protein RecF [Candidatus Dojkabacteria bacterium]